MGGGSRFQEPVRMSRRKQVTKVKEEDKSFKSPNLEAERRRREKLHGRLMALRSHVPIVTNMTKASIVEDAITYIGELQKNVVNLTEKLHEMEEAPPEIYEEQTDQIVKPEHETIHLTEEMNKLGIEEYVQLCKIGERKFWLKIITEKKAGIFTKFMEVMKFVGMEIIDITLTTSNGAVLICSSIQALEGLCDGDSLNIEQTKDFLLEVMRSNI
ncbi:Transcription factor DYT1 [Cardamine amara subsp. amara]|uniref:Transcription factor DYT1 n=1 Tax=Cardamine amara subsp. amara TaxID=228776 RepID=A0ABD0ZKM3_CARAN